MAIEGRAMLRVLVMYYFFLFFFGGKTPRWQKFSRLMLFERERSH